MAETETLAGDTVSEPTEAVEARWLLTEVQTKRTMMIVARK